ncbi:hypothetical protein NKG05_19835 [Oerskovia sp. M15]
MLDDGTYYALTTGEGITLTAISTDRMAYQLGAPVKYNAINDGFLSVMGAAPDWSPIASTTTSRRATSRRSS